MKKNSILKDLTIITFFCFLMFPVNALASSCTGIIGDPKSQTDPAYYLQIILSCMKYAALVLLAVFSVKDFFTAVLNQNQDGLKKAFPALLTRVVCVLLIFLLPTIITLVLSLFGQINDASCGLK